jgi:hypothetical protein
MLAENQLGLRRHIVYSDKMAEMPLLSQLFKLFGDHEIRFR